MRIVVWVDSYHPIIGGVQVGTRQFLPALRKLGHEVFVVTSHFSVEMPDITIQETIPVHRFHFSEAIQSRNIDYIVQERERVTQSIQRLASDAVHLMGYGLNGFFYLQMRQRDKAPYLLSIRTEDSRHLGGSASDGLLYQLLMGAGWITTASEFEVRNLVALLPEISAKISCVYHGLPAPEIPPATRPPALRLLCIGRLVYQKNFALAIQAFAQIHHAFPTARLVFAGDGEERQPLSQLVDALKLAEQVDFLGWVQPEQIPALIREATAVVLPSRWEGLPLTGIQAAQMACPLIATRVSGTPELVTDGETGVLTTPGDVGSLAAAMQELLSNPQRAAQMGQAAYERVYQKFSQARMLEAYTALYTYITSAPAASSRASGH